SAPTRDAPLRFAPYRFAWLSFAWLRLASISFAPLRPAWAPDFSLEFSQSSCCFRISSRSARDRTLPSLSFQVHSVFCCAPAGMETERQSKTAINSELAVART